MLQQCSVSAWITDTSFSVTKKMENVYLWAQRFMRLQHMQQFRVVNLQQHARDLACQVSMHALNQWKQTFPWNKTMKRIKQPNKIWKALRPIQSDTGVLPSICFCSWGGAAASIEAVRGSWPWTCTAGWAWQAQMKDIVKEIILGLEARYDSKTRCVFLVIPAVRQ